MPRTSRKRSSERSVVEWNTGEDDAADSRDSRYKHLADTLRSFGVTDDISDDTSKGTQAFAVRELHSWLWRARFEQTMQDITARLVDPEQRAQQMRACDVLERAARVISRHFRALSKSLPLDQCLYGAYRSMPRPDGQMEPSQAWQTGSDWNEFLTRVEADTAHVARIASQARTALEQNPGKPGRTRKAQRDALFEELLGRLSRLVDTSQAKRRELAVTVWAIYFGHHEIADGETARGLLTRRKRQRAQGQN